MITITEYTSGRICVNYELHSEKLEILNILHFFIVMYELHGTKYFFNVPDHYRTLILKHLNDLIEG